MRNSLLQHAGVQITGIREIAKSKRWKLIYGAGFLIGFLVFAVLGRTFVEESTLLDVDSLRGVKDAVIDKSVFLQYVFTRRMLWLIAGAAATSMTSTFAVVGIRQSVHIRAVGLLRLCHGSVSAGGGHTL